MKTKPIIRSMVLALIVLSCTDKKTNLDFKTELASLDLTRGEIALCSSDNSQFGKIKFTLACSEKVSDNFNVAAALLHSFEYGEAEKVFAKVIDQDPECIMAYWGAAMCNFHPLWEPPSQEDLKKGARIIKLARSLVSDKNSREAQYLETIATIYDDWDTLDHRTRVLKFEKASEDLYKKFPGDNEAGVFYALALRAAADPTDKAFTKQKKAGEVLNRILTLDPGHPGIAHYVIHVYDYPELANLGLQSARKYASLAAASAHAQHMPSHIFTRLGLWDESIQSNANSVSAARCYAENMGIKGHWDEELHGLDYLIYAYLQKADDKNAESQIAYFKTIDDVFPKNFKDAYSFAAIPARYVVERKDWKAAAQLPLAPSWFPWEKYYWEKSNNNFARFLGSIHTNNIAAAKTELAQLQIAHEKLVEAKDKYKAGLLHVQVMTSEAWLRFMDGDKKNGIKLMSDAADFEETTEKHPISPGELLPARELLGDMFAEAGEWDNAFIAYEADLKRHPNRFNGLYGAALAAKKSGQTDKAVAYYQQLLALIEPAASTRPEIAEAKSYLNKNQ